jgi:hypothetical protein
LRNGKREFEYELPHAYFLLVQRQTATCSHNTAPGHAWLSLDLLKVDHPLSRGIQDEEKGGKQRAVWEEGKREIALVKQHAGHWIVANRPFLLQREAEGLIYNLKAPILCDVCCYYFAVFPKRKLEYRPLSNHFVSGINPNILLH